MRVPNSLDRGVKILQEQILETRMESKAYGDLKTVNLINDFETPFGCISSCLCKFAG